MPLAERGPLQKPGPLARNGSATPQVGLSLRRAVTISRPATKGSTLRSFDDALLVPIEDIELDLRAAGPLPWADFWLNPRRLRGSDFLMRWSQGRWSEDLLIDAVNSTGQYFALPYGPSSTAPDDDVRAFELYFERLEQAGLGDIKRPDLLVFRASDRGAVDAAVAKAGGIEELPFTFEHSTSIEELLQHSILAVECENSLWKSKQMPDYGAVLRPMRRLGGKPGLRKNAVLPTVIIKEEDRAPLNAWQREQSIPIHVWHVFYDLAFGLALDDSERLVGEGLIEPTRQVFQAPGGATTEKVIYKYPYLHAYELAEATEEPALVGKYIEDKNGHILPYVHFKGGRLRLLPPALELLNRLRPRAR